MKRKIALFLLSLVLFLLLPLRTFAAEELPLVIDNADILNIAEESALEEKAQQIRSNYEMDVLFLTVDTLGSKSAQDFADDYYDEHGYGYGEDASGILVLLAMEEHEWYISTCGEAIYALSDYAIQELGESMVFYFDIGYETGFQAFLTLLPDYLDAYNAGTPVDGYADYNDDFYHSEQETVVYYEEEYTPSFFLSLVIGVIVAAVVILIMRASMNTKRQQRGASGYLKAGSFRLKRHQDLFLYSNVSKVRRQQNNSGTRGGGSSVHRSSGGRRHGGGGGRF